MLLLPCLREVETCPKSLRQAGGTQGLSPLPCLDMGPCPNPAVPPATTGSVTLTESDMEDMVTHTALGMGNMVSKTCRDKARGAKAGALLHPPLARLGERVLHCPGQEGTKVKMKEALRMKKVLVVPWAH